MIVFRNTNIDKGTGLLHTVKPAPLIEKGGKYVVLKRGFLLFIPVGKRSVLMAPSDRHRHSPIFQAGQYLTEAREYGRHPLLPSPYSDLSHWFETGQGSTFRFALGMKIL